MDEAHFSRNLRAAFRNYGAKVQNFEDKYSLGVPDMVVIYKGSTYWLERQKTLDLFEGIKIMNCATVKV